MKFTSSTAGQITALKFYRSSSDTGSDLLSLWTATGTKLASATFTNTTATGWQTVTLSAPVNISANTTYVASYHTNGAYVATGNFFASPVTSGPLTAPSSSASGGNGVYTYGGNNTAGIFPTSTYGASNYWVDVVFRGSTGGGGNNTPPTAVADTGDATERGGTANGSGGSSATGNVLTNDTDPDTGDTKTVAAVSFGSTAGALGTALAGTRGSLVLNASGAFTYTVNETAAAVQALRQSTDTLTDVFTYTMRDTAGVTSTATLTITIHGANDAPVLAAQTANQNAVVGSAFSLVLPANTFTDVDTGDTLAYSATLAGRLGATRMADVQRNDTHVQWHADCGQCRHPECQGHRHRSRHPRRQRDLQHRRVDNRTAAHHGEPVQRVEHAGANQSQRPHAAGSRDEVHPPPPPARSPR